MEKSKQAATRKEPESAHRERVQKMESEKKQAISSITDLESEIKKLTAESSQQQETRQEIAKQITAVDDNQTIQVPRVK